MSQQPGFQMLFSDPLNHRVLQPGEIERKGSLLGPDFDPAEEPGKRTIPFNLGAYYYAESRSLETPELSSGGTSLSSSISRPSSNSDKQYELDLLDGQYIYINADDPTLNFNAAPALKISLQNQTVLENAFPYNAWPTPRECEGMYSVPSLDMPELSSEGTSLSSSISRPSSNSDKQYELDLLDGQYIYINADDPTLNFNAAPALKISLQNQTALENAFAYNARPTPRECEFLAACLRIEKKMLDSWRQAAPMKPKPKPILKSDRPIANWKRKIIERGVGLERLPSDGQIDFLAAGLRLNAALLRRTFEDAVQDKQRPRKPSFSKTPDSGTASLNDHLLEPISKETPSLVLARDPATLETQTIEGFVIDKLDSRFSNDANTLPNDPESSDEEIDHTFEEEVATILGPEYAHIASALARMCPDISEESPSPGGSVVRSPSASWGSPGGLSDTSGGSSCPSSTSGHASSSLNTHSSTPSSSQKHKTQGNGGSDGSGDDQFGDGDDGRDRPLKRAKTTPPESRQRDHMMKVHFGCETCGKKLRSQSEATRHLFQSKSNAQMCQPTTTERRYEIGIGMSMELEKIYKDKSLDYYSKWIRWWNLLCPSGEETDPLHHDTINFSTADIPKVLQMIETMWDNTRSLPELNPEQKRQAADNIGKVFELLPRVDRPRRQRQLQRRQQQQQQQGVVKQKQQQQQELQRQLQEQQLQQLQHQSQQEEQQQEGFLESIGMPDNANGGFDANWNPDFPSDWGESGAGWYG
ncbi:hypothetical protein BFJ70_g16638 [Fusarium oxysporum]|nr:hypothetical protein BFJ70_g16638 [Fusarium oxysporum]